MRVGQAQEVDAEDVAHDMPVERFLRRPAGDERALPQHGDPRGEAGDEMKVVQDRDDGEAEIGHQREKRAAGAGIEMVGRFVEEEDAGFLGKRPGDLRPLTLAARKRTHLPPGEGLQLRPLERVQDDRGVRRARPARHVGNAAERHVVTHADAPVRLVRLADHGDEACALDGPHRRQRRAEEMHRAGGRLQRAGQQAQQRGLSGAVRPDDGKAVARFGVSAITVEFGRSRAMRKAVEPEEVQAQIALRFSVSAISWAALAMASAPVASGSLLCESRIER